MRKGFLTHEMFLAMRAGLPAIEQKRVRDQRWSGCQWVFCRRGERIKDFRGVWKAAAKACGLVDERGQPSRLFHDLRRTGIRNLVRSGVPERVAMMISGHRSRSVFDRYNIVSSDDLHQAMSKVEAYLGQGNHQGGGAAEVSGRADDSSNKRQTRAAEENGRPGGSPVCL